MANDQFPFPFGWYSVELGSYRSCRGTYCCYSYETPPPLEQAFTGTYSWLSPLAEGNHPMRNIAYSSPAEEHRDILAVRGGASYDQPRKYAGGWW